MAAKKVQIYVCGSCERKFYEQELGSEIDSEGTYRPGSLVGRGNPATCPDCTKESSSVILTRSNGGISE